MDQKPEIIVIGGSWGGLQASLTILKNLNTGFNIPIVLVLHRLKNFESDLEGVFSSKLTLPVKEVEEKEKLRGGFLYLAPSNYHVLIEKDQTFSLDVSEYENYSRPSIDVTFKSAAEIFGNRTTGILLSGASKDGSQGLKAIAEKGGTALVQDPAEAEVSTMPLAAIHIIPDCQVFSLMNINKFLNSLQ